MTPELKAQLIKYAQSDIRKAKKEGEILIARTQKGLVTLRYMSSTKTYEIANTSLLHHGNATSTAEYIAMNLFVLVEA